MGVKETAGSPAWETGGNMLLCRVARPESPGPASPDDWADPSPSARMVYLGSVYNFLEILRQQRGPADLAPWGNLSRSVSIPSMGRSSHPQAFWPLTPLLPALLTTTQAL